MKNRFSIFDYYKVDSDIHKLSSVSKILSILLIIFCIVIADSFVDVFIVTFFIFIVMLWSNVSFRFLIKNFSLFKMIILFVVLGVSLLFFNLYAGILWGVKIFDILLYVSVLNMTTSFVSIVYGFEKIFRPFGFVINVKDVSLKLGIGIKFLSLVYSESERINRSLMLRGGYYRNMKISDMIGSFFGNVDRVFRYSCDEMVKISNAMYLENYGISSERCNYRLNKWGKTDTILLVISVVIVIITFIY